ncbi:MAG: NAD(P)-dependent oxidoreductase [Leptolyngbyaceae cyanobacterium MO_188.B28]|nr:NAD(P)-dependent oxidoreductase [Leptolyngbyaceae cyanobacterium MO_188.B28]
MKSDTQSKTVIISGANGYFGGIACQYFEAQGWKVLKATRQDGADIRIDLDQPKAFSSLKIDAQADLFIHTAAAHEVTCREQPYRAIFQNVAGARAALDFCVSNGIPKFVYLSTFHVFGCPTGPIDELTQPLPANDYGLSNLQAEEYVQLYTRQQKLHGMVVRPSNFFGIPADLSQCKRWSLTPLGFCRDAVEKKQIVLRTPGFQQRNFVSVLDICAAIHATFPHIQELPLLHISGPNTLSIRRLAQLVQQAMRDRLSQEITLTIPDGSPPDESFEYTSRYLNNFYQPKDKIEDFLGAFCPKLFQELALIA